MIFYFVLFIFLLYVLVNFEFSYIIIYKCEIRYVYNDFCN